MIEFNDPYLTGNEFHYMKKVVESGHLSGNGKYTKLCQELLQKKYGFKRCLLTTSCTSALEMCALLIDIKPGDEVIMPSFTFVSTANAFASRGADIKFVDCLPNLPNIDPEKIRSQIGPATKAVVVVHYAGVACNMDEIASIAKENNIYLIEDAAQAIDSYYNDLPLGSIGHLATFSFHETKNVHCGEGGLLVVNDDRLIERAEIIWEKGTNRAAFSRGEVDYYEWMDKGSSFLPSELLAAFLYAQLEEIKSIEEQRIGIWDNYFDALIHLQESNFLYLPVIPEYASNNGHMFYLTCKNKTERDELIEYLLSSEVKSVFHYLPLHSSYYYKNKHDGHALPNSMKFADSIIRLPMHMSLTGKEQNHIAHAIHKYFIPE